MAKTETMESKTKEMNKRMGDFLGTGSTMGTTLGSDLPAVESAGWTLPVRSGPEGMGGTIFSDIVYVNTVN